jgi:hypothetical protein
MIAGCVSVGTATQPLSKATEADPSNRRASTARRTRRRPGSQRGGREFAPPPLAHIRLRLTYMMVPSTRRGPSSSRSPGVRRPFVVGVDSVPGEARPPLAVAVRQHGESGSGTRMPASPLGRSKCPCTLTELLRSQKTLIWCHPQDRARHRHGPPGNGVTFAERKRLVRWGKMTHFHRVARRPPSVACLTRRALWRMGHPHELMASFGQTPVEHGHESGSHFRDCRAPGLCGQRVKQHLGRLQVG